MPGDWWLIRASWAGSLNRLTAGEWVDQRTEETTQPHRGGKGKGEAEDSGLGVGRWMEITEVSVEDSLTFTWQMTEWRFYQGLF